MVTEIMTDYYIFFMNECINLIDYFYKLGIVKYVDSKADEEEANKILYSLYNNNYTKLKKKGYSGKTKVYDNMPFGSSGITWGEYLNIDPIGLTKEELKNYYIKRKHLIDKLSFMTSSGLERIKKAKQKKRITDYVLTFDNPIFITITFNKEWINRDFRLKIKRIMKSLKVRYILLTDYGKTGRIHFHGFINANQYILDNLVFTGHYSRKGHIPEYELDDFSILGFCPIQLDVLEDVESRNKSINYCVKYITKELDLNVKHNILRDRSKFL